MERRRARANALRNAASALITGHSWSEDAAEFGALDETSLSDDQVKALDVVDAIVQMFEREDGALRVHERALLDRLHREVVPLAFRTRDGAAARALERIEDVAIQVRADPARGASGQLITELLTFLEDVGYPVRQHWSAHLPQCAAMVNRVQVNGGQFKRGAAGLLADLLVASDPTKYPDRDKLADALRAASKRGLKTM